MIKIEHNEKILYIPETDLAFYIEMVENKWRVYVYWIVQWWTFDFETKDKAYYFLDRYFKGIISDE